MKYPFTLIFVSLVLVSGCTQLGTTGKCPFPDEILPAIKQELTHDINLVDMENYFNINSVDVQGYNINFWGNFECRGAEEEGENINYAYCEPTWASPNYVISKETVDSEGNIVEKFEKEFTLNIIILDSDKNVIDLVCGPPR